jgi:phage terminase large subunit
MKEDIARTFDYENCTGSFKNMQTRNMDVFAGLDVGYRDPTAFCVIAYDWDEKKYYVLDEYMDAEQTTEHHASEIQAMITKWDIDYIYIDSAAQQTRFDFAQNYDISTVNAKKSLLDGIAHVDRPNLCRVLSFFGSIPMGSKPQPTKRETEA